MISYWFNNCSYCIELIKQLFTISMGFFKFFTIEKLAEGISFIKEYLHLTEAKKPVLIPVRVYNRRRI